MAKVSSPGGAPSLESPAARGAPFVLGVTGASGLIYAERAVQYLLRANYRVELVASRAVYSVYQAEEGVQLPSDPEKQAQFWRDRADGVTTGQLTCHRWNDIGATIASGSFRTQGMVVMPCSMATVAKLAAGLSGDLLERTADVHLKEGRLLGVVPRETPLSAIHLRNLTTLAEAGVAVIPAIPAWYHRPQTIDDLVDFVVARVFDRFGLDCVPLRRWDGGQGRSSETLE